MKKFVSFLAALALLCLSFGASAQQHSAVIYLDGAQQLGGGSIRNTADPWLYITDFTFNLGAPLAGRGTFHEVGAADFTDAPLDATHYGVSSWNLAITPGDTANFSGLDISEILTNGAVNDSPSPTFVLAGASIDVRWVDGFTMHRALSPQSLFDSTTLVLTDSLPPVAPVPEPEDYAMFAAGLGVLGFAGKRRRVK